MKPGWSHKGLVTGQPSESAEPNKFIMKPARGKMKCAKIMYAPVKLMTPEEYAKAKK